MSMEVLQNRAQIVSARRELARRNVSSLETRWQSLLRRIPGLKRRVSVGDMLKSWDVLATLSFLDSHVAKDQPVLDIGCYASEVIVALHKMGYSHVVGIDLNSNLDQMPFQKHVRYEVGNFMHTKFDDASFMAISAISVIEHGFNGDALLREVSRLLQPGGYFIASFDYWPEKIDTTGVQFFGMDWLIFSKQDVSDFAACAKGYGLTPFGEMKYDAAERAIDCAGKQYTFGWMVLQKSS